MRRLAVVALFLVASCGSFLAQSHTIALSFKAGDTHKYKLHLMLDYKVGAEAMSIPLKLDVTANDTVTVKSVDADGTAHVNVALTDTIIKSTLNGTATASQAKDQSVDLTVSSDG